MVFVLAALGLPGTSSFVGEFLVLVGAFKINFLVAILASTGVVLSAAYMLWLYKRVVFGKLEKNDLKNMKDINVSESVIEFLIRSKAFLMSPIIFSAVGVGLIPLAPLVNNSSLNCSLNLERALLTAG